MKSKNILSALLILSMFNGLNTTIVSATETTSEIPVGQAVTLEERVDVALREIDLNIDLNTVVTDILVPTEGLYESTLTWVSSDETSASVTSGRIKITRPAIGQQAKKVTLTVTAKIIDNRETFLEKTRDFEITILPFDITDTVVVEEKLFNETFESYPNGEDIGEYLSWQCSANDPLTEVVDKVPNNEMVDDNKALKINSVKTAKDISYTRSMFTEKKFALEAYVMFYGELNGVFFEFGRSDIYGPLFGLTHESYYYAQNGDQKFNLENVPLSPTEGVWQKFRLEVDAENRRYSLKMYKMDGTNATYSVVSNIRYSGSETNITDFRIRVNGGDKVGSVYLADLKMDYVENFPVTAFENPNRENGIGNIKNFEENVLFINGDEVTYDQGIQVYNRFDSTELYEENTDYTISKEVVSTSNTLDELKYTITLKETGEVKELTQTIYKEEANGLPYITDTKTSHLAREVTAEGTLSSVGNITFKGNVTRDDGTIYYGLATNKIEGITAETIINCGSQFIESNSIEQTTRNVSFTVNNLPLSNEYFLYVVIKNENGTSEIYKSEYITEVINIATCEDFYNMTIDVTTFQNEFRLLNDLDFSNYTWICDPSNTLKWEGILDGQGHTISNLKIESPYRKAAVFFEITNATIKNLNFDNCHVYGLQDSALICGYSNGGDIENITITNSSVNYNKNAGSEGYFAMVAGRLHKDTTNMKNIIIDNCYIDCNKYTGALTGNVNKNNNCVLNATNIYCDIEIRCDGAAIGLVGRNRGTTNIENCIVYLEVRFAKKEMGSVVGHNKEGGVLNVKNLIGTIEVREVTQPTYFNNFIGSQDDSTSKYSFENVYFFEADYTHISDSITPIISTRTAGTKLSQYDEHTEKWWEENTFITCFETDAYWVYDSKTQRPKLVFDKQVSVTAEMVNEHIAQIKNDYSKDDHYHIYQALEIYEKLSDSEKAKVDVNKLNNSKENYDKFIESIREIL